MTHTFVFSSSFTGMEDVICPSLTPPTNGSVEINEGGRDVGSEATYDCDEGFELEGPQRRTCQSNGAWSGRVPTCKRKFVYSLPVP